MSDKRIVKTLITRYGVSSSINIVQNEIKSANQAHKKRIKGLNNELKELKQRQIRDFSKRKHGRP